MLAERAGDATKLEWVADSDFRFFPTVPDRFSVISYIRLIWLRTKFRLLMAGASRATQVDLLTIHDLILPLGAAVWASAGKALGFTPEGIINEIRRIARYTDEDFRRVASDPPLDAAATMKRLRKVISEAEGFVARKPTEKVGLLFLESGEVVQPDPDRLPEYETHAGERRGHWPSSMQIDTAMLERYKKNS